MPTINLLPKKDKSNNRTENTDTREIRKQLYNTDKWRKCRKSHLVQQPLCQRCLQEGKINAGTPDDPLQVHHIKSPFIEGKINYELAYDDNNLETICSYHHGKEHTGNKPSPEELLAAFEELLKDIE